MVDELDLGPEPRPAARYRYGRGRQLLAVAVLIAALAALVICVHRSRVSGPAGPAVPAVPRQAVLAGVGPGCGVPGPDGRLILAARLDNLGDGSATLGAVTAEFPLGGLTQVPADLDRVAGNGCDHPLGRVGDVVAPGRSVWVGVVVQTDVPCPDFLPVHLRVAWRDVVRRSEVVVIPAFPDLGGVVNCPTPAASPLGSSRSPVTSSRSR